MPPGCSPAVSPEPGPSPPEEWPIWRMSLLKEIARGRAKQSRGKHNPRGVKRKMSGYRVRKRSEPLNRVIEPKIVIK